MTPVERAAAVYQQEPCARAFQEDLEAHLLNGYVFSTPEVFVMGRVVVGHAELGLDPTAVTEHFKTIVPQANLERVIREAAGADSSFAVALRRKEAMATSTERAEARTTGTERAEALATH